MHNHAREITSETLLLPYEISGRSVAEARNVVFLFLFPVFSHAISACKKMIEIPLLGKIAPHSAHVSVLLEITALSY